MTHPRLDEKVTTGSSAGQVLVHQLGESLAMTPVRHVDHPVDNEVHQPYLSNHDQGQGPSDSFRAG
jgi:hypothetical protein